MNRERRQLTAWAALVGLVVFGLMAAPFFLGRVYVADDLGAFHLPLRDFYARQLAAGQPWDWMPTLYCGFYVTGEGQLGGYHPLHLLLYRCFPLGVAFNLELLLNYPFLALGTYLFLRRLLARRDAAAFGALVFTFSSFNLLHFIHPNAVAVVAHLPWLLWAIDLACRSHRPRTVRLAQCAIALLTGSQLLLGYPQYVWFSLLGEAAYVAYCFSGHRQWRRVIGIVGALAVGGLIGAIQLLPTIDALAESSRQTADADFRNSGSLAPLNLVQLVEPYLFHARVVGQNTHELGLYLGAVPLVLCCWLLFGYSDTERLAYRFRRSTLCIASFAVIMLLYSFGQFGPIYWMQAWLPGVNAFRFPCRAIVLVQLAMATLAAIAWTRLVRAKPNDCRGSARLWWLPVISLSLACLALLAWPEHCSDLLLIAIGPLLIAVAVALVQACAHGRRWAAVALLLFAATDLAAYGLSYAILPGTSDLNQFAAAQKLPAIDVTGRIVADDRDGSSLRTGNQMLLAGYSRADGYAGLEPQHAIDAEDIASLRKAGVGWVRSGAQWREVSTPLAKYRLDSPGGMLSIEADNPGQRSLQINANAPSHLTIAERYHAGWQARLDGVIVPIIRSGNFMGCDIPPGKHRLDLAFQPVSLRIGGLLTLCGLGLTLSWVAVAMLAARKPA